MHWIEGGGKSRANGSSRLVKQPTRLMEHAAPFKVRFLSFGIGVEPEMVTARFDGRGMDCFSSER